MAKDNFIVVHKALFSIASVPTSISLACKVKGSYREWA